MRYIAIAISVIAHPFLLPMYILIIIFNSGTVFAMIPGFSQALSYAMTFMGVILIPILTFPVLKHFKLIGSFNLNRRQDRSIPLVVTILCTFIVFYMTRDIPYIDIVRQVYLVTVILLSGFMLVTLCWKMSMHMAGVGALCGFVFVLGVKYMGNIGDLLMCLLLAAGLLGSSSIFLKRHTPAQVYVGFVYGCGLVVLLLY